jgi:hypothetical protein
MKKNVGKIDTWIRILVALLILVLYYFDIISGTLAIVLLVAGIVLLLTSLLGFCPLYTIFKINTCKKEEK